MILIKPILYAEDDPNDVFFMQRAFKQAGIVNPLHIVTNGSLAIDYLAGSGPYASREENPLPCPVLLDLKMPGKSGLDVLKWIRQQPGMALPVVILTASAEEADIAAAYRLGANGFLTKPCEAGKLEDLVRAIKEFWLTHNLLPEGSATVLPRETMISGFTAELPASAERKAREGQPCRVEVIA